MSVSGDRMCTSTGKSFRMLSLPRESVVRKTDQLIMTLVGGLGHYKTYTEKNTS